MTNYNREAVRRLWNAALVRNENATVAGDLAVERLRRTFEGTLQQVLEALDQQLVSEGEYRWHDEWQEALAVRVAAFLGIDAEKRRSGGTRFLKVVYVTGPAALVDLWEELLETYAPRCSKAVEEAWAHYQRTSFPLPGPKRLVHNRAEAVGLEVRE